jgi:hypothetical protein
MINETIFNGLIEALARGESLQNAMFSFFNAGYGKQEIEEAAKELFRQTGGQAEKMINPKKPLQPEKPVLSEEEAEKKSAQPTENPRVPEQYFNPQVQIPITPEVKPVKPEVKKEVKKEEVKYVPPAPKPVPKPEIKPQPKPEVKTIPPVTPQPKPQPKPEVKPIPPVTPQPKPIPKQEIKSQPKPVEKQPVQIVSTNYNEPDESVEELNDRIESAISTLRNVRLPSKIEIINLESEKKSPSVLQRVSDYNWNAPSSQANEWVIVVLIIIFILLLGTLVSVFLFKDQLIELFSNWNIG